MTNENQNDPELFELLKKHERRSREANLQNDFCASQSRARSVSVGTAFGGVTEISMRRSDGNTVWALLQPVEVVEFINQLAANIGCHIHLQPRQDFASWRHWKHSEEELAHFRGAGNRLGNGHPPHAKSDGDEKYKTQLPPPDQQPGLQPAMMARSESNEQTVATQKTVGRKRTKRAAAAA